MVSQMGSQVGISNRIPTGIPGGILTLQTFSIYVWFTAGSQVGLESQLGSRVGSQKQALARISKVRSQVKFRVVFAGYELLSQICNSVLCGSAKSASQRANRAIVRAMRVTRVMRAMRATVQMLRIFISFIYIRVRKFGRNFFFGFFFFFRFCYNFGENFAYSKSPKMRKKIKTIRKNLLRFKTSGKKNPRKTYGCTATRIGIY